MDQVLPHSHKDFSVSEKDLLPDDTVLSALPASELEGRRVAIESGGSFTFYQYLKGAWRMVGTQAFRDWRYPESQFASSNQLIGKAVTSASTYTVPTGKRLYIFSIKPTANTVNLQVDGKNVAGCDGLGGAESWQGRLANGVMSFSLANPIIADESKVVKTDSASTIEFVGFLVTKGNTITVINQNVSSGTGYTVPSGKLFVLLNAYTVDNVEFRVTPSGDSQRAIGKNINMLGSAGGWVLMQPWFFFPGDVLKTDSAFSTGGTINGYEIAF